MHIIWVTESRYDAGQKAVIFELTQSGIYSVGYDAKTPAFTDITGYWAKEAVKSMQQVGKTNNCFDPTGTATRAEVATVL